MKRFSSFILAVILMLTGIAIAANAASDTLTTDMRGTFYSTWQNTDVPVFDGLKNSKTAEITDNVRIGSYNAVLITPKPANNSADPVVISHKSMLELEAPMKGLKYIRYHCYFGTYGMPGYTEFDGRAKLVLKASDFNLVKDCTVYSVDKLVPNEWNYITFDVGEIINNHILVGGTIPQMEFYPYGDTPSNKLSEKDCIAFSQMSLHHEGSLSIQAAIKDGSFVPKYPVYFVPGRADTTGEMETMYAAVGDTIILPECEFEREGYEFLNWICSYGANYYNAGDEYTVETTFNYNSPAGTTTGHRYFFANWKKLDSGEDDSEKVQDIAFAGYSDYWGGLVKPAAQTYQYTYATPYKNYEFDGVNTLRLTFNPNDKDANRVVNLDGHTYNNIPLDISQYKYLAIPYYFKTSREVSPFNSPRWAFLIGNTKALKTSTTVVAKSGRLKTNQWAFMVFEFDFMNNSTLNKNLNPDSGTTIVNQCHFYPFGHNNSPTSSACAFASKMLPDDEIYFGNFIFMTEIPSVDPTIEKSFIKGYEDGSFRPLSNLTKAEAVVLLTRALGVAELSKDAYDSSYSDLAASTYDWCRPYVGFLEAKGIIPASGGTKFNPSEDITVSAFLEMTIKAKAGMTDSADSGKLPAAVNTDKLTRAKAVSIIYSVLKDKSDASLSFITDKAFTDVSEAQWYYADIMTASKDLVSYTDKSGNMKFIDPLGRVTQNTGKVHGVTPEQVTEGDKKLAEIEELTNRRINEIRTTESEYSVKPGGKIVYVSTSDGTADGGNSEYEPKRIDTLNEVNSIDLQPGDVLLFKRGDTFRGYFSAKAGVTYSAYGIGDKPLLTRSPENGTGSSKWILDYEDKTTGKKIWKYYNEDYIDAGGIILYDDYGNVTAAYKEVPSTLNKKFWVRGYKPGENSAYPDGWEFDYIEQLDQDLEFFHKADSVFSYYKHKNLKTEYDESTGMGANYAPDLASATGPIYLRCDKGNPGALYSRIEFNLRTNCINVGNNNNVTVDNLCIMYFGSHGVGAGNVNNLKVTNCEIGWGGGAIQNYQASSNYTNPGHVVRFGNGIEIYGGCGNYTIDNCYVYQIYDAGITHQVSGHSNGNYFMENVLYTNNVLTDCIYNIEYFLTQNTTKNADGTLPTYERMMDNVRFEGNICRRAGYGWGVQRPDGNVPSNIRGWGTHNLTNNYVIENNIFDRCVDFKNGANDFLTSIGSAFESSTPLFLNNTFVQVPGRTLMGLGTISHYSCTKDSEALIESFGGVGNKVYFVTDDREEASKKVFWRK